MKWKRTMRRAAALLAAGLCMLCSGCDRPQGYIDFEKSQNQTAPVEDAAEKPLRIAFASVISPKETRQAYQVLVNYISQEQQRPAILLQRRTYAELNKLMADGDADIAFFSTGAYAAYRGQTPIELLAMVQTNGSVFYQTYLITAADSDITDFSQLQGRVFAFTDPLSYSGRQAVDFLLLDQGLTAETYFKRSFYTYNHDKSIWAVANHLADGASIDSQIYDFVMQTNPQLCQKTRIFAVLPQAPTGPVVMRSDLPETEKAQLRHIFYTMDLHPSLHEALEKALINKFVEPQPELYAKLQQTYNRRTHLTGE